MYKIISADIFSALNYLNDNSVDVAITSPPYWGQRNYGFDKQIGRETTYIEFVSRLVFLFDILKKKLSGKGVFFLNIGDKYLNKYGKTPLGLIPYKLAYFMQQNGWIINDTIIWHKPNHMPSSVKNRFVNSYEPVFVLSKNKENYFTDYIKENRCYSNVIDVNLQPTQYKHVAVYPENLVSKLLDFTKIDKDYTILDPFAGSGTTLKVINDKNVSTYNKYKATGIMIEFNQKYIDIIKNRTKLNVDVIELPYVNYKYPVLIEPSFDKIIYSKNTQEQIKLDTVNVFKNNNDFYKALTTISNEKFIKQFPKNEIIFIGLKNYTIDDIYNISLIKNWIIRNKLVVKKNKWYPIFMLVHDNKTHKYNFNYKSLSLKHKTQKQINYNNKNFIGYKIENNIQKKKTKGVVVEVVEKHSNGLPKYVKALWENKTITKEYVINDTEEINKNIVLLKLNGYVSVKELIKIIEINNIIKVNVDNTQITVKNITSKNYNGKFNNIERVNWGASPGARKSVEEEVFAVQRLYNVNQNIIADYLNYIRKKNNLTKKAFAEQFPKEYKYTVGHWLRKDFGGSIPVKEDWELLEKLFNIDENLKNYACKTGLKLQTVSKTKYKMPDDVIDEKLIKKLKKLNTNNKQTVITTKIYN